MTHVVHRGPGRTKTVVVPGVGAVVFAMRFRDRRGSGGFAVTGPRPGILRGFGLMHGFGKRRSVLVQWEDDGGVTHYWIDGPWIGCRGRASGRYGMSRAM